MIILDEGRKDLTELGFRERAFEKVDPFTKCDDETRDQLIQEEKDKVARLRQGIYGDKPPEPMPQPILEKIVAPAAAAEAPGALSRSDTKNVRKRLKMDAKNLGKIMASQFGGDPELEFSDVEQEVISEGLVDILELNDEKFKDLGKTMSALEIGGIMLNKAMIINRKTKEGKKHGHV